MGVQTKYALAVWHDGELWPAGGLPDGDHRWEYRLGIFIRKPGFTGEDTVPVS
jgi:hypothetical protein